MSTFYGDNYTFQEGADTYEVTATYGNRGSETVKLNDGSTIDIFRGTAEEDEQTKKLQQEDYVMRQSLAFQAEQDMMSKALQEQHPDGRDYTKSYQEYILNRRDELIKAAPVEAREGLAKTLTNLAVGGISAAQKQELKMSANSLLNTFEQSKQELLNTADQSPELLDSLRLEAMDRIKTIAPALKLKPEQVGKAIQEFDKELVRSAVEGMITKDPSATSELIDSGKFDKVFNEKEKNGLLELAYAIEDQEAGIKQLPPITTLMRNAQKLVASNTDLEQGKADKTINPVEYQIAQDLKIIEGKRMENPEYRHNKELLTTTKQPGITAEDEQYGQERLQNLYDSGKLNEQSIKIINDEIRTKIIGRMNNDLQTAKYFPNSVEQLDSSQIETYKSKIRSALKAGEIDIDTARAQGELLRRALEVTK